MEAAHSPDALMLTYPTIRCHNPKHKKTAVKLPNPMHDIIIIIIIIIIIYYLYVDYLQLYKSKGKVQPACPIGRAVQGYGYIGARTDTTQQTNICLGIHRRHVWLHLIQHVCPGSIRYVLSTVTTLEFYAHCSRYLTRLSARNKLTLLAPDSQGR